MDNRYNGNQGYRGSSRTTTPDAPLTFPSGYLTNGYFDNTGKRDVRYITKYAVEIGKALSFGVGMTAQSKIRSYYDEIATIKEAVFSKIIDLDTARIRIAQLTPRVNARYQKGTASKFFKDFIDKNVDVVIESKTDEELRNNILYFKDHFEAVVCYTKEEKTRK